LGESLRVELGFDQASVPPLREPMRSQEANAKKRRELAPVGMTGFVFLQAEKLGPGSVNAKGKAESLREPLAQFHRRDVVDEVDRLR
jgi:hypothetical protein